MATITTRSGKGSPLTNTEVDSNFTNLNTDKVEKSGDSMTGNLSFGDNDKAIFGTHSDLKIYHDGSHSYIEDSGVGNLNIKGTDLFLRNALNEVYIGCVSDGTVYLRYDNATKLATTSTGINVTGTVTADGLTVSSGDSGATANSAGQVFVEGSTSAGISIGSAANNSSYIWFGDSDNIAIGRIRYYNTTDQFEFRAGNVENALVLGGSQVVVNESSADIDFRVESNNNTHALFVQGSDGYVGINYDSPVSPLHINRSSNGNITAATLSNYDNTAGTNQTTRLDFGLARNSGALKPYAGRIQVGKMDDWTNDDLKVDAYMSFSTYRNNALQEGMWLDHNGNLTINGDLRTKGQVRASGWWNSPVASATDMAVEIGTSGGNGYILTYDRNTSSYADLNFNANNIKLNPYTNGYEVVVNDNSQDTDFRVESNNNTDMIFVDAGNDSVNFGTSAYSGGDFTALAYADTRTKKPFAARGGSSNGCTLFGDYYKTDESQMTISLGYSNANVVIGRGITAGYPLANTFASTQDTYNMDHAAAIIYSGGFEVRSAGSSSTVTTGNAVPLFSRFTVGTGGAVFNDTSHDADFRVESDGNTHMLFVDGGTNSVSIGTSSAASYGALFINGDTVKYKAGGFAETTGSLSYSNTGGSSVTITISWGANESVAALGKIRLAGYSTWSGVGSVAGGEWGIRASQNSGGGTTIVVSEIWQGGNMGSTVTTSTSANEIKITFNSVNSSSGSQVWSFDYDFLTSSATRFNSSHFSIGAS